MLLSTEAAADIPIPNFLFLPRTLMYLKIQINDPVDEFQFPIPNSIFGMCTISRLNTTWSMSTTSHLLESSISKMFPVGLVFGCIL